jgi:predicted RNase H-like HicB family nuclease
MVIETIASQESGKVKRSQKQSHPVSVHKGLIKRLKLPIVLYKEDDEYIAECPLFYVSSHGHSRDVAIKRVKEALELYLEDENVQKTLPSKLEYTRDEVIKISKDLFFEYSDPDEKLPLYEYREIDITF